MHYIHTIYYVSLYICYIGNKITKLIKINDSARKTTNNSKSISFTSLRKVSSKVYIGKLYNINIISYQW